MRLLLWLVLYRGGNLGRRRPGEPVPAGGEARGRASAEHGQRQHAVAAEVCDRAPGDRSFDAGRFGNPHAVMLTQIAVAFQAGE
jgi:hypothetical protein